MFASISILQYPQNCIWLHFLQLPYRRIAKRCTSRTTKSYRHQTNVPTTGSAIGNARNILRINIQRNFAALCYNGQLIGGVDALLDRCTLSVGIGGSSASQVICAIGTDTETVTVVGIAKDQAASIAAERGHLDLISQIAQVRISGIASSKRACWCTDYIFASAKCASCVCSPPSRALCTERVAECWLLAGHCSIQFLRCRCLCCSCDLDCGCLCGLSLRQRCLCRYCCLLSRCRGLAIHCGFCRCRRCWRLCCASQLRTL